MNKVIREEIINGAIYLNQINEKKIYYFDSWEGACIIVKNKNQWVHLYMNKTYITIDERTYDTLRDAIYHVSSEYTVFEFENFHEIFKHLLKE